MPYVSILGVSYVLTVTIENKFIDFLKDKVTAPLGEPCDTLLMDQVAVICFRRFSVFELFW